MNTKTEIHIKTENKCHLLSLTEGTQIGFVSENGVNKQFNYADIFVAPTAAGFYKLINQSDKEVKSMKAFVK